MTEPNPIITSVDTRPYIPLHPSSRSRPRHSFELDLPPNPGCPLPVRPVPTTPRPRTLNLPPCTVSGITSSVYLRGQLTQRLLEQS